jgi:histidine ammonia-lyase
MTLENATRVAFERATLELGDEAIATIAEGRARFVDHLAGKTGYVYGSNTAPGARAKVVLSEEASRRQGDTLRNFLALRAGVGGEMLPERCVRLAVFSRLSNAMSGAGKLRPETVRSVAGLLTSPPPVPLQSVACSGEVMPLTWLMAPLADLPLAIGEAMALINGSPFATALACDVALTARRRVKLAVALFSLSAEAAQCPAGHFDRRLADGWPDPFYKESLSTINGLLAGSKRNQLKHQAPTSWRVLPNILASALQSLEAISQTAAIGLQSLKDNPTFLRDAEDLRNDAVVSSGGYHDHRAAKAIDQINSVFTDLCYLASRQVVHLLDGGDLGLPPLLARHDDLVGLEYLAWGMTEPLATARRSAVPTTLDVALQDPAGNQSDIASLTFITYGKHRVIAEALDVCLSSLAMTAVLALEFRDSPPPALRAVAGRLNDLRGSVERRADVVGEPLRQCREWLRTCAEEMTTTEFSGYLADN